MVADQNIVVIIIPFLFWSAIGIGLGVLLAKLLNRQLVSNQGSTTGIIFLLFGIAFILFIGYKLNEAYGMESSRAQGSALILFVGFMLGITFITTGIRLLTRKSKSGSD